MGNDTKLRADLLNSWANVIAPVKSLLASLSVNIPPNVYVTDWLPVHKANPMADISVIHGGIGTVMTVCLSGTQIVGISMMAIQQFNFSLPIAKDMQGKTNYPFTKYYIKPKSFIW